MVALAAAAGFVAKWASAKAKESQTRTIETVEFQVQGIVDRHVEAVEQESKPTARSGPLKKEMAERGVMEDLNALAVGAAKTVGKQAFWGLVGNVGKRIEKSVFSGDLEQKLKLGGRT